MTPRLAQVDCWCCGGRVEDTAPVHLGNHPEVVVCLRCAHFLHRQARAIEDVGRASPAARVRGVLRGIRALVVRRGWHQRGVVGRVLRWVGHWTP